MNTKKYNVVILLSLLFAFASCVEDDYETSTNCKKSYVTLQLPEEAVVEVKSRSTVNENTVDDVLVFLFRDGKAKYQSFVAPTNVGSKVSFTLTKFAVEAGETLYVVCNTGVSSINATNAEDFLSELTFSDEDNKMIMYGSKEIGSASNNLSIQLERMLAKVTLASDIAMSSWKICNVPTKGFVGRTNIYPTGATFDRVLSPAALADNVYFVPRTDNSTTTLPKTYLLVQLTGKGWYKLDFCNHTGELDEAANVPVLDLESNTHYMFNIETVNSNGYETEAEAAANPGSNVVYSMTTTGSTGDSNGQYMLQVDRDIITLYPTIISDVVKALEISAIVPSGSGSKISTFKVKLVNPSGHIKLYGDADGDNNLNLIEPANPLTGNSKHDIYLSFEGADMENSYLEIQLGNIIRQIPIEMLSANCYLADFASKTGNVIYIPVMQANKDGVERIAKGEDLDVDILWYDQPGVDLTLTYDKEKQWITVKNNTTFTGNVVIIIQTPGITGFAKIRWSWHIWSLGGDVIKYDANRNIYDFKTEMTKDFNGFTWMDRNLGAYTLDRTNDGSWGLLYQYGRKDPFPGARFDTPLKSKDIYCIVENGTKDVRFTLEEDHPNFGRVFVNVNNSPNNLEYSIAHPMNFITGMMYSTRDDFDWYTNDGTLRNNYLWLDEKQEKTPYNPCPPGWTLPFGEKSGPFVGIWPKAANIYTEGVFYDEIGYVPFIPYRTYNSNASQGFILYASNSNIASQIRWGNTNDNAISATTFAKDMVQHADQAYRADAMPVRCVRDK